MSQIIQFPNNYDSYILQGKQALAEGKLVIAKENFIAGYELQADFEVNVYLVSVLLELGEYELAKNYAVEMSKQYQQSLTSLKIYVSVLQMNQEFLAAKQLLSQNISSFSEIEQQEIRLQQQEVEEAENHYRKFKRKEIQELKTLFQELPVTDMMGQLTIIKKARKLPQLDFLEGCQIHLTNNRISQLVRGSLLENLKTLEIGTPVKMLCFDQENRIFIPNQLSKITDNKIYQESLVILKGLLQNDDPVLFQALLEELRLCFAVIYPLAEEIILDVPLWIGLYVQQYQPMIEIEELSTSQSQEIERIRLEQEKIREKIASIVIG